MGDEVKRPQEGSQVDIVLDGELVGFGTVKRYAVMRAEDLNYYTYAIVELSPSYQGYVYNEMQSKMYCRLVVVLADYLQEVPNA